MASPLYSVHGSYETDKIVEKAILSERERCAKIAEAIDSGRGNEKLIAASIRKPL